MWTLTGIFVVVSLRSVASEVIEEKLCSQDWTFTNKKNCWRLFPIAQPEPSQAMLVCHQNDANLAILRDNADSFFAYHMLKAICLSNPSLCDSQLCLQNEFNTAASLYPRNPMHVEELSNSKDSLPIERPIHAGEFIHLVFKLTSDWWLELNVGKMLCNDNFTGAYMRHFKIYDKDDEKLMTFNVYEQDDWGNQPTQEEVSSDYFKPSKADDTPKRLLFLIDVDHVSMFDTMYDDARQLFTAEIDEAEYAMPRMTLRSQDIYDVFVAKSGALQKPITSAAIHCYWGHSPNSAKVPVLEVHFNRTFALCERQTHVADSKRTTDLRMFVGFGGITVGIALLNTFLIIQYK